MAQVERSELFQFLRAREPQYYGKLLELRESIGRWLGYVPQTFPHYTRHTIEHSDEIIIQASKLLFMDDDPTKPVVPLSAIESYVISAAAYLHDAGMVASDREKVEILGTEAWGNGFRKVAVVQGDGVRFKTSGPAVSRATRSNVTLSQIMRRDS
jgi:hypothetical protein